VKASAVGVLIAYLASLPALADCVAPQAPPHLPDGATASREDMVAAMQTIKVYEAAVKEFSDCAEHSGDAIQAKNAGLAVDRVKAIAEKFNSELITFKKKHS
jgi:hypothetical protein